MDYKTARNGCVFLIRGEIMIICFILMVLCFTPYFILSGLIKYYARKDETSKIKKIFSFKKVVEILFAIGRMLEIILIVLLILN